MEKTITITTCIECPYYHEKAREIWPEGSGNIGFYHDHICTIKSHNLIKREDPMDVFDGKIPSDCPL